MKWGEVIGGAALAALAALSATGPARAADMTPVAPRQAPSTYIPAQFYWTGFYMGAGLGDGWGTAPFIDPLNGASATPSISGFLITGVAGINYQIGSAVLGAEGDFTGDFVKGTANDTTVGPPPTNDSVQTKVFWTASITGRLGWAIDRLLIFGKGGVAFDYDRNTSTNNLSGASVLGTTNHVGWTVGGGAEYAITEHWTARLEYDYLKFASKAFAFTGPGAVPITSTPGGLVAINLNEIKAIMSYKF
jgi:outer membrane immunogenic protein